MRQRIGWTMFGFLIFSLFCGLGVPLGLAVSWWAFGAFVGSGVFLLSFIGLAVWLTE